MAGNTRDPGRSVTARAMAVLSAFDPEHPRLTLSDISRRTGLPLTTVHRLAGELETWRALQRNDHGLYEIGLRLWEVATLAPVNARLRTAAMSFMQDLYEATRENVHLAIRDGFDTLYVEKLTGNHSVSIISRVGGRLPMHTTGVGKVLLAYETATFIRRYCSRPLERPTRYSIVERGRLLRLLAEIRMRGYALAHEEMTLGSSSVAVPILHPDGSGTAAAALGIVVHSVRADLVRLVPPLRAAAHGIEQKLVSDTTEEETPDDRARLGSMDRQAVQRRLGVPGLG